MTEQYGLENNQQEEKKFKQLKQKQKRLNLKTKWYDTTIRKILQNEKYIGDALLQKTYTRRFFK